MDLVYFKRKNQIQSFGASRQMRSAVHILREEELVNNGNERIYTTFQLGRSRRGYADVGRVKWDRPVAVGS